jgi:protein-serine/threonine kinase
MEFCTGGDLYSRILAAGKLTALEADCYFSQLMRGIEHIHETGVAHRDIKPENLLLTGHGAVKIADFGNAECFRTVWEVADRFSSGVCGSVPYIAPEEYTKQRFDPCAVDVWACGITYMAMRTGRHLWNVAKKDDDALYEKYLSDRKVEEGYLPVEKLHKVRYTLLHLSSHDDLNVWQACRRNVIYSMLDPDPTRRIDAGQVLRSQWVRGIKTCHAGNKGL